MALQSKMTVYLAIAGVLAMMGGIVYYGSLDNVELEQVEIELQNVELLNVNAIDEQAKFTVTFLVKNLSDKTFTVSLIDYELFGDETLVRHRTIFYRRYFNAWKSSILCMKRNSIEKHICSNKI